MITYMFFLWKTVDTNFQEITFLQLQGEGPEIITISYTQDLRVWQILVKNIP